MQVKDAMTTHVVDVQPETPIWQAIRLMQVQKVSGLPVVNRDGRLVGMLSEGDLLRRIELGTGQRAHYWYTEILHPASSAQAYTAAHARRVGDVMSHSPITIEPHASLDEAVALMERHRVKRLPVVEGQRLFGIISRSDFLRILAPMLAPAYEEPATSDAEIERVIKAEMKAQPWAGNAMVTVKAADGRVSLHGTVATEAQRTALRILAENVNGVRSVSVDEVVSDEMIGTTA